jgi:peroxiredoxin (alkyl hydroperoxide reductase subunit C)
MIYNPFIGQSLTFPLLPAVMPDNSIEANFDLGVYIRHKAACLFFYPLDFTFVCPSELIALDKALQEFEARNIAVVAISIDSQFSHLAYKNTPRDKGGIGKVAFPMIADINKQLAAQFQLLHPSGVALRSTILIDKHGVIRQYSVNDLPLGRNIHEIIRIFDAIDHHATHGEVCPANWNKGKAAMKPTQAGVTEYLISQE